MAEPEDIAAALEPHHAILNDGMAEQLANHFWRDDLASVDASLLPGVVAARLADPQWANFRKPAVEPPPLHQPGSIGDIADRFKQRLGAGGRHPLGGVQTNGITSGSLEPHPAATPTSAASSLNGYLGTRLDHAHGPSHGIIGPDGKPISLTGKRTELPRRVGRRGR